MSLTDDTANAATPADSPAALRAYRGGLTAPLTADTVTALQSMRAYPSISLLANTTPGRRLDKADLATLLGLAADAEARLEDEAIEDRQPLLDALSDMISRAVSEPSDRAVAFFVSPSHQCRITIPVPVVDRCVVDPTFATRDLVRSLQHSPRHTVLLLSLDEARLLHGHGTTLSPAPGNAFPAYRRTYGKHGGKDSERYNDFLRRVDRALAAALRLNPMPLVLVAAEPTGSKFRRMSLNMSRLAGIVPGNYLKTPTNALSELVRPVLDRYLRSRAQEALDLIERRAGEHRVLRDVDTAWLAARWERPEMLAVEEDFFYPARLAPDGDILIPADDVDHPDVIDGVVDELIEIVLSRGGWIALLPPGRLPEGTHLALTLRQR
ncbi:baeRF3 domain-containing protein [Mycobacterium sp. IDR2000157661]|uniref:baeRF3 domain-containing protein n=1 Tax=Mycobacterium sp. IDR2000157661 TaxID=2867005 RepID=UPI001EED381A|nr:hypothetical protein [Mycobacterium sp. IDR2000157661]